MTSFEPVLTRNIHDSAVLSVKGYRSKDCYDALAKALKLQAE